MTMGKFCSTFIPLRTWRGKFKNEHVKEANRKFSGRISYEEYSVNVTRKRDATLIQSWIYKCVCTHVCTLLGNVIFTLGQGCASARKADGG